jgi:hypothetical protein
MSTTARMNARKMAISMGCRLMEIQKASSPAPAAASTG